MGIFLPEKILTGTLAAGMTTIKGDLNTYLSDIFDADELGADFVQTAVDYLTANSIKIMQGYPLTDKHVPGWFVVPASSQETEDLIGGYGIDEEGADPDTEGVEIKATFNQYQVKIISASKNGDVTLMLDAIARYIMLLNRESLSDYNMNSLTLQATDFDPVYQFLPEELFKRTTIVSFQGVDTWVERFPLIQDAQLFVRFNPNEEYIEIP